MADYIFGTASVFNSTSTSSIFSDRIKDTEYILAYYNNSSGFVKLGTYSGSFSYGTAVELPAFGGSSSTRPYAIKRLNDNKFICLYNTDNDYPLVVIGELNISTRAITFGLPIQVNIRFRQFISASISFFSETSIAAVWNDSTSRIKSANITISGTVPTVPAYTQLDGTYDQYVIDSDAINSTSFATILRKLGSPYNSTTVIGVMNLGIVVFGSLYDTYLAGAPAGAFDSSSIRTIGTNRLALGISTTTNGTSLIATVLNDNELSFGGESEFNASFTGRQWMTTDGGDITISYQDSSNSGYGTAVYGTIDSNSIAYNTKQVYNSNNTTDITGNFLTEITNIFSYKNTASNYGESISGTLPVKISFSGSTESSGTLSEIEKIRYLRFQGDVETFGGLQGNLVHPIDFVGETESSGTLDYDRIVPVSFLGQTEQSGNYDFSTLINYSFLGDSESSGTMDFAKLVEYSFLGSNELSGSMDLNKIVLLDFLGETEQSGTYDFFVTSMLQFSGTNEISGTMDFAKLVEYSFLGEVENSGTMDFAKQVQYSFLGNVENSGTLSSIYGTTFDFLGNNESSGTMDFAKLVQIEFLGETESSGSTTFTTNIVYDFTGTNESSGTLDASYLIAFSFTGNVESSGSLTYYDGTVINFIGSSESSGTIDTSSHKLFDFIGEVESSGSWSIAEWEGKIINVASKINEVISSDSKIYISTSSKSSKISTSTDINSSSIK